MASLTELSRSAANLLTVIVGDGALLTLGSMGITAYLLISLVFRVVKLWWGLGSIKARSKDDYLAPTGVTSIEGFPINCVGDQVLKHFLLAWQLPANPCELWEAQAWARQAAMREVFEANFKHFEQWINTILPTALLATTLGLMAALLNLNTPEFKDLLATKLTATAIGLMTYLIALFLNYGRRRKVEVAIAKTVEFAPEALARLKVALPHLGLR